MNLENYLQSNYSASNYKCIFNRIKKYQNYTLNHEKAHLKEVLNYLKIQRDLGKHPKTIDVILHAIKVYYNYLQYIKKRKDHPCKDLQLKDKIDKSIKTQNLYTQEELQNYYYNTPKSKQLMVSLLIHQALTTSEIISLKVENINLQTAQIHLHNRTLALKAPQIYIALEHVKNKKPMDYIFITKNGTPHAKTDITRYINIKRKKQEKITPLRIRQSVIRNLLNTHDIRVVQVFAGHRKSATTQMYKTTFFEELKLKINQLHPLQ